LLGQIAQNEHNDAEMLRAASEVLSYDSNNIAARLLRVAALMDSKLYQEARNELAALSKLQPKSDNVELASAKLAEAEKDYTKAEGLYNRVYRPGSSDLRPLEGLLRVQGERKHLDKAEKLVGDELKRQPDSRAVHLLAASVATEEGKFEVALEQYRWLQSKDPKSARTYSALGDLYRRQGATENALASYEKASELEPNDSKTWSRLAVLESSNGHAKQAIAALDKELALEPGDAAAMNNLAFNLAETGQDLDRARTLAETVARKFPNDSAVIDTLGWVYAKRGLNQSAIQVLRGLVRKNPNEPAFHYHLAIALAQDNQSGDAKTELQAALSEHPDKDLSGKIQEGLKQVR
jgi:Flp pilus assembly protein TadD